MGIFESDSLFENGALIMPLETLQKMMGREGQATGLVITAKSSDPAFLDALRRRIEAAVPGVAATPARDYVVADTQIRLARAMAWATAAVAMILGAVGMLNTMLMSIFERTREIGILRAVGWRRRRVLALVLGEALAIALAGTVLGVRAGRRRPAGPDALAHRAGVHRARTSPPRCWASRWSWASA